MDNQQEKIILTMNSLAIIQKKNHNKKINKIFNKILLILLLIYKNNLSFYHKAIINMKEVNKNLISKHKIKRLNYRVPIDILCQD